MPGVGTNVRLFDDQVSGALPIGFVFDFYGNTFSNFYISSNGFITFSPTNNSGCCSGQTLPTSSFNNIIAVVWDDLFPPGNGSIDYFTTGSPGSRRLVVNFTDIPFCCGSTGAISSQLILYEGTNLIEIHTAYANGVFPGTMGISNGDGSQGQAVPGRDSQSWTIANDYVAFIPCGASIAGDNTYYLDADGDGFGDPLISVESLCPVPGYVTNKLDCDDSDPEIHPGFEVDSSEEWIESMSILLYENVSGNNNGYGDYTDEVITLAFGDTYEINLSPGFPDGGESFQKWRVYIDYNQDCVFQGNERLFQVSNITPVSKSFKVQGNNVEFGQTTMRVIMADLTYETPCATDFNGEIEDYTVEITACDEVVDPGQIAGEENLCLGTNDPGPITNVSDAVGGTGAIEYLWFKNTDNCDLPTGKEENGWELIDGASQASYDPGPITTSTVYVRFARAEGCVMLTQMSNLVEKIYTNNCTPDCQSFANSSSDEWIRRVKMGNMAQNSGSDGGYGDYTNRVINVHAGNTYPYQLRPGYGNGVVTEYWNVWVDWNQDGFFDPLCESLITRVGTNTQNGTFQVPDYAKVGSTLMRVSMNPAGYSGACDQYDFGEVEEYSVNVITGALAETDQGIDVNVVAQGVEIQNNDIEMNVYPNPAFNEATIQVTGIEEPIEMKVLDKLGRLVKTVAVEKNTVINFQQLGMSEGVYLLSISGESFMLNKKLIVIE